ncbi:flagellar basal body-associated protein FliL [Cytobacillus gottheilii]|uniref:Flagellar protein FliL n=1 Tax=Cytobacillus gottheilii TaxID=859144 RepID=A0ABX8FH14_9BACI|nr:flagellar basal body-associated protein FliL [Cytobacillus gottheilii]QVY63298.1 flagellar basal body-associated protein FliL [Cytobacillus gottheilii]
MKNNKLLMIMIFILIAIALVGAIVYFTVTNLNAGPEEEKEPSIDEVIEASVEIPEITTNLASGEYLKISFMVQTDDKKAKEELEKRSFQVKNIIIQELADMNAEEVQGKDGQLSLQENLKAKVNELMQEGQIVKVYITESLLQ